MIYAFIGIVLFLLFYKNLFNQVSGTQTQPQPPPQPTEITWNDVQDSENIKLVILGGYGINLIVYTYWVFREIFRISLPDIFNVLNQFSFESGSNCFVINCQGSNTEMTINWQRFSLGKIGRIGNPMWLPVDDRFLGQSGRNGWVLDNFGTCHLTAKDVKEGIGKAVGLVAQLFSDDGYNIFKWKNLILKIKLVKPK